MVLGVIAFVLSLPGVLCASMCAGVLSGMTNGQVNQAWYLVAVLIGVPLINMIACFRCKSKSSRGAGILIILTSVVFMIVGVISGVFIDFIPAVLFFIAGALCISNTSRPA